MVLVGESEESFLNALFLDFVCISGGLSPPPDKPAANMPVDGGRSCRQSLSSSESVMGESGSDSKNGEAGSWSERSWDIERRLSICFVGTVMEEEEDRLRCSNEF